MSTIPQLVITDTGLEVPTGDAVLEGVLDDIDSAMGGTMSKDLTTPQGQIAMSMSYSITAKNTEMANLVNNLNPDFATGRYQDALGAIYFITRKPARGTTVTATCTGSVGTLIPKGSQAQDDKGYIYESQSDATIDSTGSVDVIFVNLTTGAIGCPAGSLNKIYLNVNGWDSIINKSAGSLGQAMESRNDFEARRRESVAGNSKNQNGSILAAVLALDNVVDAYVYSNDEGTAIEYGITNYTIPAHTLCISVYGGDPDDIGQIFITKKSTGCGTVGNTSVTVQDKDGYAEPYPTYTYRYLIPTTTQAYFKITIQKDENLPSTIVQDIQAVVKSIFSGETGSGRARIGGRLLAGRFYSEISDISEYVNIDTIFLSKDNSTFSSSIQFGIDEMPVVSNANIEVIMNEN